MVLLVTCKRIVSVGSVRYFDTGCSEECGDTSHLVPHDILKYCWWSNLDFPILTGVTALVYYPVVIYIELTLNYKFSLSEQSCQILQCSFANCVCRSVFQHRQCLTIDSWHSKCVMHVMHNECFSVIVGDPCAIDRLQGTNSDKDFCTVIHRNSEDLGKKIQGWVAKSKAWDTDIYLLGVPFVNKRVESMWCKQKGQRLGKQTEHNQDYVVRVNKLHVKALLCEYEVSFWYLHQHI